MAVFMIKTKTNCVSGPKSQFLVMWDNGSRMRIMSTNKVSIFLEQWAHWTWLVLPTSVRSRSNGYCRCTMKTNIWRDLSVECKPKIKTPGLPLMFLEFTETHMRDEAISIFPTICWGLRDELQWPERSVSKILVKISVDHLRQSMNLCSAFNYKKKNKAEIYYKASGVPT